MSAREVILPLLGKVEDAGMNPDALCDRILAALAEAVGGAKVLRCAAMDLHDCNGPEAVADLLREIAEASHG